MLVAGTMSSWAQSGSFSATLEQEFKNDYLTDPIEFKLSEMAAYFGVDAATFATDMNEFIAADKAAYATNDNSDKKLWIMQLVNGGEFTFPNADLGYSANLGDYYCGFWMDEAGKPRGYGDGAAWYWLVQVDAENDAVQFLIGQMPSYWVNGGTSSASLQLNYNSKTAYITLNVKFKAKPVADLPEPETDLSKLVIVQDYTLTLPFTVGKYYEGKTYSATLDGIYDALGVTAATFDEFVADYVFTQVVHSDTLKLDPENQDTWSVTYSLTDNQLQKPEAASGGAWYGRYGNAVGDTEQVEYLPMNAPMAWGAGFNTFYTQNITLAEGVYTITSGQYPDKLKVGDTDYTYHYIIVGNKAARVKIQVEVSEPETIDPNAMVLVGEETVEVTAEIDNNYATKAFTVDMENIVGLLGCTTDDLEDVYAWASEGEISDNHTEGSGGFYYNEEGYIISWGSSAAFFIARSSNSLSSGTFTIGQMSGHYTDITEPVTCTADLIFQHLQNYYLVHVAYTVKPESQHQEDEKTLVGYDEMNMEIVPAGEYKYGVETTLNLDYIESKIGTRDFEIYTDKWDGTNEVLKWAKNKTLSDNSGWQGFWFGSTTYEDDEHRVVVDNAGWSSSCSFGIGIETDGVVTWWQYPNARQVGDSYNANLYFFNPDNNKYVKCYVHVEYVETPSVALTKVGEEDVIVVLTDDHLNDDGWFVDNDLAAAFEALEMDASEYDSGVWYAQGNTNVVNKKIEVFESSNCQFDANGQYTTNPDDFLFAVAYDEGKKYFYVADYTSEWNDETLVSTRVGFANPGAETPSIYIFNVYVCGSQAKADWLLGIAGLSADERMNINVYDLSGRIVSRGVNLNALQRGTYIINNKKVIIK